MTAPEITRVTAFVAAGWVYCEVCEEIHEVEIEGCTATPLEKHTVYVDTSAPLQSA